MSPETMVAISQDGITLWTWGDLGGFQIRSFVSDWNTTYAVPLEIHSSSGFVEVTLANDTLLSLQENGRVYVWRSDGSVQPLELVDRVVSLDTWASGSIGDAYAVADDGSFWWDFGEWPDHATPTLFTNAWRDLETVEDAAAVDVGGRILVLRRDGTVLSGTRISHQFRQVANLENVVEISSGGSHDMALRADGTVWTWGRNTHGQLGDNDEAQTDSLYFRDRNQPAQVPGLSEMVAVAAGENHSLALKADGTVWAWGDNMSGQVGDGSTLADATPRAPTGVELNRVIPRQVVGLTDIVAIAADGISSAAVKADGTVWTWGGNGRSGVLGDGSTQDRFTPVQVLTEYPIGMTT